MEKYNLKLVREKNNRRDKQPTEVYLQGIEGLRTPLIGEKICSAYLFNSISEVLEKSGNKNCPYFTCSYFKVTDIEHFPVSPKTPKGNLEANLTVIALKI